MTEEKKKHRQQREDFSEISYDFLSDDDCVYSPFDKNYDVPFIIPEEVLFTEEEKTEEVKIPLTLSEIPDLVLEICSLNLVVFLCLFVH